MARFRTKGYPDANTLNAVLALRDDSADSVAEAYKRLGVGLDPAHQVALVLDAAAEIGDARSLETVLALGQTLPLAYPSERLQAIEAVDAALRQSEGLFGVVAAVMPVLSKAEDRNTVASALLGRSSDAVAKAIPTVVAKLSRWPRARVTESIVRTLVSCPASTVGALAAAMRESLSQVRDKTEVDAIADGVSESLQSISTGPVFTEMVAAMRSELATSTDHRRTLEKWLSDFEKAWESGVLRVADAPQGGQVERNNDVLVIGGIRVPRRTPS